MITLSENCDSALLESCLDAGTLSVSPLERSATIQRMNVGTSSSLSEKQLERIRILGKDLERLKGELELLLETIQGKSTSRILSVKRQCPQTQPMTAVKG